MDVLEQMAGIQQRRRGTGYFVKEWNRQMNAKLQALEDATINLFNDPSEYAQAMRDNAYLDACNTVGKQRSDELVANTLRVLKNRQPA